MSSPPPAYDPPSSSYPYRSSSPTSPTQPTSATSKPYSDHSRPLLPRHKSLLDEILPIPTPAYSDHRSDWPVLRRTLAVGIIMIFFSSVIFLALTTGHGGSGMKSIFSSLRPDEDLLSGSVQGIGGVKDMNDSSKGEIDFEHYTILRTLPGELPALGKRLILIGDIHGSIDPLKRLMTKIQYDQEHDRLIHVGDLIAKGEGNDEVLSWMREREVMGVRGNHDQPVIQWRAWMEWAGGRNWQDYVDGLEPLGEKTALSALSKNGKMFPKDWEWKGEHWQLAREIQSTNYHYLLNLPLVLHLPVLHTFVVHAGLLPSNQLKSSSDPSQPLVQASNSTGLSRASEELGILFQVPQNSVPWNLLNIRSVLKKGKHRGEPTNSSKKGTPWSDIWNKEMKRCRGEGAWADTKTSSEVENEIEDSDIETEEEEEVDELKSVTPTQKGRSGGRRDKLPCSPITVIYGHAAGRGLDIKRFSKGIDTGCVYGKQLTGLIIGDTSGLEGEKVRVGDHEGLLVHEQCGKNGT
ncbi:hypothetical protein TREMEDRAFT_35995 [Tremella mesenterica DSM 1558]|uniref:uncharacterized protein n=1 Tax=Tremella mesenterica (strain ATCC 24925 / CBS 8224 / DSM 1558 / NBRC 9311 / NRRL Y-6157 / RJB 2259-6 / UBC 559-6) TaxID=578456 RepID=UPI00032C0006|nr:uncharacterized protein TREMEDRAFT_35995 [Tremella mesenterica DSM 1558]EIW65804.1 hypothetical protein TREMEDRAFT_35995 [Tremella mesenterica DSM 1558]